MTKLRAVVALVMCLAVLPVSMAAQGSATASSKYAWDQAGPDLATVQAYAFKAYIDGATTGTVLTATCTGASAPFVCTAPIGAFTQGSHSVKFTAGNAAGESAQSAAVTFTFVIVPSVPANPRIQ